MEKSSMNHKETPYLQLFPCKKYCISLCTEFLYNVYQCSLQRLWGLPATFTIFPINIEDFPLCNTGTPQNFHNVYRVFPAKSIEKDCMNHKETPYFLNGIIVHVGGNPCNIYRL